MFGLDFFCDIICLMNTKTLKQIYSKEYLILISIGFLPLIWKVLEITFLSTFDNALKILGQIALINIIFKVFSESILNPLYKLLGNNNFCSQNNKNYLAKKFLIVYFALTILFTALLFFVAEPLMQISKVPLHIFNQTIDFLKIYIIACGFEIIANYLYTFNIINKNTRKMFVYLLIKAMLTALCFIVFVPNFTLKLGVNGIAISNIIVNVCITIYLLVTFPKSQKTTIKLNVKQYLKLFLFATLETLTRNVVYYCVILVFLNMLNNQDLYFVANEYIWSIMLVPVLAQSTLIKQDIANNPNFSIKPYFLNCILLCVFMVLLIPISLFVFRFVYNLNNFMDYFLVLLKLLPCYFVFVFDSVIEALFFATGKLHHILIQTIITNILIYLTAFVLYLCNVFTITLNSIILLFNLGVVVSSAYTICVYLIINKKHKKQLIQKHQLLNERSNNCD